MNDTVEVYEDVYPLTLHEYENTDITIKENVEVE